MKRSLVLAVTSSSMFAALLSFGAAGCTGSPDASSSTAAIVGPMSTTQPPQQGAGWLHVFYAPLGDTPRRLLFDGETIRSCAAFADTCEAPALYPQTSMGMQVRAGRYEIGVEGSDVSATVDVLPGRTSSVLFYGPSDALEARSQVLQASPTPAGKIAQTLMQIFDSTHEVAIASIDDAGTQTDLGTLRFGEPRTVTYAAGTRITLPGRYEGQVDVSRGQFLVEQTPAAIYWTAPTSFLVDEILPTR